VDVGGVAGENDSALAIGCGLTGAVGVAGGDMQSGEGYIGAGDSAKDFLQGFEGDLLVAIECRVVEVDDADAAGARAADVHAVRREVEAGVQFFGVGDVDPCAVAGELGIGAFEFESCDLSYGAAAAVATDEPLAMKGIIPCLDGDSVF
jgi:hypothetical protein